MEGEPALPSSREGVIANSSIDEVVSHSTTSPPRRGTVVLAPASPVHASTGAGDLHLIGGTAVMEWLASGMAVFEVQCELGRGSFGRAVLAKHVKDGQFYVIKQINIKGMSEKEKRAALREVQVRASPPWSMCAVICLIP